MEHAFNYLQSIFPSVPHEQINNLIKNPIVTFTPEATLIKINETNENIYLILTGEVKLIGPDLSTTKNLTSGEIAGDISGKEQYPSKETYRAANYVQALQLPCSLYIDFIKRNELYHDIAELKEKLEFLQKSWLFGNELSYIVQTRIAKAMLSLHFQTEEVIPCEDETGLYMVKHGKLQLLFKDGGVEILKAGDSFGECNVLRETHDLYQVRAVESTEIYRIQRDSVRDIPIIHWKLLEIHEKRLKGTLV